jgi:cysteine desulfurase
MQRIYFDHNSTTPVDAGVREKTSYWLDQWGNPSSVHQDARGAKNLLRESRQAVAELIGARPLEVVFTSGGTESNNLAIKGVFQKFRKGHMGEFRNHYFFSGIEHPSVRQTMEFLKQEGAYVEEIKVDRNGMVDLDVFAEQVREDTALVSVMFANNETGTVLPIKKMAKIAHKKGALFHTDAVQSLGKSLINVKDLDVDLASFSGHKFYALRGVGVLYSKQGTQIESLLHGGGQERYRRGGTENLLAIASLAEMAQQREEIPERIQKMEELRDSLENFVLENIEGVSVTGAGGKRVANTSNLLIDGIDGEVLLMKLDLRGISVSTGSACSSGSQEPSIALQKMGLTRKEAQASLRISLGWNTTQQEIDAFCAALPEVVSEIRALKEQSYLSTGLAAYY